MSHHAYESHILYHYVSQYEIIGVLFHFIRELIDGRVYLRAQK